MSKQSIIMHYTTPPSLEDLQAIAASAIEQTPQELFDYVDGLDLIVEDFPDESLVEDLDLEDEFDLLALYTAGADVRPGLIKRVNEDDEAIILYRRPILDAWCDTEEDLNSLIAHIIVTEIAQSEGFSESQIAAMLKDMS
tara:strand:+ start:959 stop:1378 length:420 start_codon:yes stop_codon:yes gene_type:complete